MENLRADYHVDAFVAKGKGKRVTAHAHIPPRAVTGKQTVRFIESNTFDLPPAACSQRPSALRNVACPGPHVEKRHTLWKIVDERIDLGERSMGAAEQPV
jgi:hypothetical protein